MLEMFGRWELVLKDESGKVKLRDKGRNLVTNLGERQAADRFAAATTKNPVDYITLGSGTTPPLKTDTALGSQIDASDTQGDDVISLNQVTWSFSISGPGVGNWDVAEIGIFNDDYLTGTRWLVARFLTQPFTMSSGDQLDVTWTIEFSGVG